MISAEPPNGPLLERVGQGGVGTLRVNLAWGSVQPGPHAPYDWIHLRSADRGGCGERDARPGDGVQLGELGRDRPPSTPTRLGPARLRPLRPSRGPTATASDGTFWSEHPNHPPSADHRLAALERAKLALFWKPTPNVSGYLKLLRAFHGAVKGADAGARMLLAGLFPTPSGGITMRDFIAELYDGGGGGLFDAVAIHPYAAPRAIALTRVARRAGS